MRFFPLNTFRIPCLLLALAVGGCRTTDSSDSQPRPTPTPTPSPVSTFRRPPRGNVLTGFERLAGWTVSSASGKASLVKNADRPVWGSHAAEIRFHPEGEGPHEIVLTPDAPLVVRAPFNRMLLWAWDTGRAVSSDGHAIRLEALDASARVREWRLPYTPLDGWDLLHLRETREIPWPVEVRKLVWEVPAEAKGPRTLYLDTLSIYQEVLGRVPREIDFVRPHGYAPAFAPVRDNSVKLDFPRDAHAFRPYTPGDPGEVTTRRVDDEVFQFILKSGEMGATYQVKARGGGPEIRAWTEADGEAGGIEWRGLRIHGLAEEPELRFARLRDGRLWLQYTEGVSFECIPSGGGLRIAAQSLSENVTRFDLGRVQRFGGESLSRLHPPFLRLAPSIRWPVVWWTTGDVSRVASVVPDWWFSMAAAYHPGEATPSNAVNLGSMRYPPRWRGSRNVFRERLYFTVSDRLEHVLPQPAHPGGLYAERLQHGLLDETPDGRQQANIPQWKSFSENRAEPMKATRLLSIRPVREAWTPDLVGRTEAGDWTPHPGTGMVVKTGLLHTRPIMERLDTETQPGWIFERDLAAHPPWRFTDYDARLPGAGTFAQSWAEVGAFLQQVEAETAAPIVGRDGATWFWAGLVSGLMAEFLRGVDELHPFLPHVSWTLLHPRTVPLGLGSLESFRFEGEETAPLQRLADRMLACMVAYGATGRLPALEEGDARRKLLRFQRALHPRLATATVDRIGYWNGERFLDAARALADGSWRDSRLYLQLSDATEIWVNGHRSDVWEVRVDGTEFRLPPFGFVARGPGLFALAGATPGGAPLWILETSDSLWIHSPAEQTTYSGMSVRGSAQWRKGEEETRVELSISHGDGPVRLSPARLGLSRVGTLEAEHADGSPLSGVTLVREDEYWVLRGAKAPAILHVHSTIRGRERNFVP